MHNYRVSKNLERILAKLRKKDKQLYKNLWKKMQEILQTPELGHYKNLRHNLKEFKRVHIGSFVLIFKFDKQDNIIFFDDFDHHDNIYRS